MKNNPKVASRYAKRVPVAPPRIHQNTFQQNNVSRPAENFTKSEWMLGPRQEQTQARTSRSGNHDHIYSSPSCPSLFQNVDKIYDNPTEDHYYSIPPVVTQNRKTSRTTLI